MSQLTKHRFLELKATGDLPSPTGVALNVLEHLQNREVSTEDITSSIQADPALAGRLIKLANSLNENGNRTGSRPTVSLSETISRVGPGVTRHITLGLSVLSTNMQGQCLSFDYENFWSYSLAMGISTELLSKRDNLFPEDEAFTVGLLSNTGRLGLANVYPEQYSEILKKVGEKSIDKLLAAEQKQFFTNHLEMACAMLKDWGLPAVHYDAIYGIYEMDQLISKNPRAKALAQYLNYSARLASLCVEGGSQDHPLYRLLEKETIKNGIDPDELSSIFDQTVKTWTEWSQLLDVPIDESTDYDQISRQVDTPLELVDLDRTQEIGLQILIVDDDPDSSALLERQLTKDGHSVSIASSGKEALKIALEETPQLLITDLSMPEMDGLELCRTLRKTRIGQKIYIIVLTAKTDEESLIKAFKSGVDDFIEKPVRRNIVKARIRGGQRVFQLQEAIKEEQYQKQQTLAELAIANKQLEQAALTDALTKIPNRRYATSRLDQEWATSDREQNPLSCMLIDIDLFKGINDTYGHDVGDTVLYEVAQTLRTAARVDDEVCRIGGEEFLVICANTDLDEVKVTAERLREAIEALSMKVNDQHIFVTISIGIATRNVLDSEVNDLLKAADQGVYSAKSKGRNQVCVVLDRDGKTEDRPVMVAAQPVDVTALS
ncbi:MAG: diguanylate cyclase [Gammaproteobacteria bacterium]